MQVKKGQQTKKTSVFNAEGKEFKVTHGIDVKEWLDAGYTLEKPEEDPGDTPMTKEEFAQVKDKLKSLDADGLKKVAVFLDVEYTNKKETLAAIEVRIADDQ